MGFHWEYRLYAYAVVLERFVQSTMSSDRIPRLLEEIRILNEDHFTLLQALRELILGFDASVSEEVKYGGILFSVGKPFCGILSYANHVSVEFGAGASMPDKHNVLEGNGKLHRHIKLSSCQDIENKHICEYLLLAFNAAVKL